MKEYINLEYGYILTKNEMEKEARELYDLDDPTNTIDYLEYYIEFEGNK